MRLELLSRVCKSGCIVHLARGMDRGLGSDLGRYFRCSHWCRCRHPFRLRWRVETALLLFL